MWTKFRHKLVFAFFVPIFWVFLRIKYGFHTKEYKLEKGSNLILFNHPTAYDPFMVSVAFKKPIYFMATDDIFSVKVISPIIRYLVAPIPKSKSFRDIQAVKDTIKIVKEGGIISLSPEGNRTYSGKLAHIDKAIVKLIKHLKIPVVLYTIKGGFGVHPRFSTNKNIRRGKTYGEISKILSKEEVTSMSNDDLYDEIINNLSVDDFNTGQKYKGKRLAERLERIFYLCPVCGSISTLHSDKNQFSCSNCLLYVEYTEDLRFKTYNEDFKFETVDDWYVYQEDYIRNLSIDNLGEVFYDNDVTLKFVIKNKKKNKLLTGRLSINRDYLIVENEKEKREFLLDEIFSMAVMGQNKLNFYIDKDIYQLKSDESFNALKYMQLYFHIKGIKQGENNEFLGI